MFNAKISIIQLLIILLLSIIVYIFIREKCDDRPFKFEDYNSDEVFKDEFKKRFPIGSNIDEAIEILVKSGINDIKITDVSNELDIHTGVKSAYFSIDCYYSANLLSFSPRYKYSIYFLVDKNRKILHMGGRRMWFLGEFWW